MLPPIHERVVWMLYTVEYYVLLSDGTKTKLTQKISQVKLAEVLTNDKVVLIGVNRMPGTFRHRKKAK